MCTGLVGPGEMAKIITVKEAAELVQDGAVIGSAVQGMTGWPRDFGRMSEDGKTCRGECALVHDGLLSCSIHGHVGCSFKVTKQIVDNKILAHNIPLGVVGQIWREMGRGFPGLLTKVGLGTFMDPRYDGAMVNEKTKKEGKGPLKILRQRGPLRLSLWPDIKRTS